jgi:hypothetical protein
MKAAARLAPLAPKLLVAAPELAALALLDRALAIAERALIAEHPLLAEEPAPGSVGPPCLRQARLLLGATRPLRRALARYRLAVRRSLLPPETDHDLPF